MGVPASLYQQHMNFERWAYDTGTLQSVVLGHSLCAALPFPGEFFFLLQP